MTNTAKTVLRITAALGFFTVALGAFGAHGLKPHLSEYQVAIFEKGIQYQFYHTLAIMGVGVLMGIYPANQRLMRAVWLFVAGIACFSGSLYLLSCRDLLPFSVAWAGPITPIGGLCFMAGWGILFIEGRKGEIE